MSRSCTKTMSREAKQILVVRKDLHMRKGKIAAQCAHASMKVLLDQTFTSQLGDGITPNKNGDVFPPIETRSLSYLHTSALYAWLTGAFAKICVYVNSEEELLALQAQSKKAGIMSALIVDSGRTEFHGVPTKTVLAIGPAWKEDIDKITGHLPLL